MKTAILVSGLINGSWENNIEKLGSIFPDADVFTATWKGRGDDDKVDYVFDEPTVNYNPTLDTKPYPKYKSIQFKKLAKRDNVKLQNTTKQLLIHDLLLNEVCPNDEYDMIIRMRFDTHISTHPSIDWNDLLSKSYQENITLGFANRNSRYNFKHGLLELEQYYPPVDKPIQDSGKTRTNDWAYYVLDPLIIHPRKLWDSKRLWDLHYQQKLHGSENGFYQILSEPYGDKHVCYYGAAIIERFLVK